MPSPEQSRPTENVGSCITFSIQRVVCVIPNSPICTQDMGDSDKDKHTQRRRRFGAGNDDDSDDKGDDAERRLKERSTQVLCVPRAVVVL